MRGRLRQSAVLAGVTVLALGAGASPANAAAALTFEGSYTIDCSGCGTGHGSATLSVTGAVGTRVLVLASATADFTVQESPLTCPLTGSAIGTFSGALAGDFTWTRVGATVVWTTAGDINGAGVAALLGTSPIGVQCHVQVDGTMVGVLAGT